MSLMPGVQRMATIKTWFSPIVMGVLALSLVISLPLIVLTRSETATLEARIANVRDGLHGVEAEVTDRSNAVKQRRELADRNRFLEKQASEVLRQCREAADVPHVSGPFIAAADRHGSMQECSVCFFVPQGDHRLEIDFKDSVGKQADEYHFEYPLISDAGYKLYIVCEKSPKPSSFHFELTCSSPEFETLRIEVPIPDFVVGFRSTWGSLGLLHFPGELQKGPSGPDYRGGVEILRHHWTGSGKPSGRSVKVSVKIVSDGTPCANPNVANSIAISEPSQEFSIGESGRVDLPGYVLDDEDK